MNIKSIADKIGIDYENTLEDFCGDVSALNDKIHEFLSSNYSSSLREALESGDYEKIKSLAHEIRNKSEKIGIKTLVKASRRVEDSSSDKTKSSALVLIDKLDEITSILKSNENNV